MKNGTRQTSQLVPVMADAKCVHVNAVMALASTGNCCWLLARARDRLTTLSSAAGGEEATRRAAAHEAPQTIDAHRVHMAQMIPV